MADGVQDAAFEKYDTMYTEAIRLKSFKNWPFGDDSICSAAKMAEAGFFHCPTEQEPDAVQCYVCFKELDGWEATDEPWAEHYSHSEICLFAQIRKPQKDQTSEEIFQIEAERKRNKARRLIAQRLKNFREKRSEVEDFILDLLEEIKAKGK